MFLEQHYQMGPKSLENRKLIDKNTIVKFELFYCLMPEEGEVVGYSLEIRKVKMKVIFDYHKLGFK